ncbi:MULTISPECIES: CsbD family protein [Synechococcaceae]|uniref:CsbD family protein n=2 Tax=Synechococcales TaxID=1890424 RepID=UPI00223BE4D7|nr:MULTISPECIES: CsbD family protein [Synechococcaceae]MCT4364662.1 CsbD family protein [Candidatus Regnicoccus frigidus MAG-AL1]MCT4368042.1 CsbD family protein [Candidatus Regnicoccus frigidus MAG-AL2]
MENPMITIQRIRQSMMSFCLAGILSIAALLSFIPAPVSAASPQPAAISQPRVLMLFGSNKATAASKELKGKTQESIGKATGDPGDRLAGMAKQGEANVRNAVEDVKDATGLG